MAVFVSNPMIIRSDIFKIAIFIYTGPNAFLASNRPNFFFRTFCKPIVGPRISFKESIASINNMAFIIQYFPISI